MSTWFRIQELVVEIGLRLAKVALASLLGAVLYWILTNVGGAAGSTELALGSWLAGAAFVLLVETGIF